MYDEIETEFQNFLLDITNGVFTKTNIWIRGIMKMIILIRHLTKHKECYILKYLTG